MTTLTTDISFQMSTKFYSPLDLQTGSAPGLIKKIYSFADGAGVNAANRAFFDRRTLSASATESLDLAGSLVDAFGSTITWARVKVLAVTAASANTNNVIVGGTGSNGFINWVSDATDAIVVRPGGMFVLVATDATGYAVTAATGDLLKIANSSSGTSVTYDIAIIGAAT